MSEYKIEIDEANVIRVWDEASPTETGAPFLLQDVHPDGHAWADRAEAEAWITGLLASWEAPAEETPAE
jgi:hypothetical protein